MSNILPCCNDSDTPMNIGETPANLPTYLTDGEIASNVTFAILDRYGNSNPDDCIIYWPTFSDIAYETETLAAVYKAVVEGSLQEIFNLARRTSILDYSKFLELSIKWDTHCDFKTSFPVLHVRLTSEYEAGWVKDNRYCST